ncbi:MAG: ribosome-associated translation inhibitor RaiA [Anaerolineae bacterium]|nr:ribosome-associated translation inhibitor RaiA [Thermoflexales bacterium]MDW8407712.1 ribosome-associated translation inhibitor RaiA [Anaerolineae bacterium]
MQLTIQGHGWEISRRFEEYVHKKADRLDRYLPGLEDLRVEVTRQSARDDAPKSLQLTIRRKRTLLRVEEQDADLFKAFDAALDKMYHRIARYKGRRIDRKRAGLAVEDEELATAEALPIDTSSDEPPLEEQRVVRVKTFPVVPMSIDEAIEQMELLGHDFFVFMHADDNAVKVVYRRKAGDYGLLQPEK